MPIQVFFKEFIPAKKIVHDTNAPFLPFVGSVSFSTSFPLVQKNINCNLLRKKFCCSSESVQLFSFLKTVFCWFLKPAALIFEIAEMHRNKKTLKKLKKVFVDRLASRELSS